MTAVHTINVNGLGWVDADPDIEQIRIRFGNEHKQDTLIVSPAWLVGGLIRALRQAEALSTDPPANAGHMDFELSDVPLSDLMSEMDRRFRASSGGPAVLVPLSLCEQIMPSGWDAPDTPWGQFRALVANSGVEAETRVLAPSLITEQIVEAVRNDDVTRRGVAAIRAALADPETRDAMLEDLGMEFVVKWSRDGIVFPLYRSPLVSDKGADK